MCEFARLRAYHITRKRVFFVRRRLSVNRREEYKNMKIYLLSCADSDEGGGIYECELSENGTLNQTDYFACDRPMYAVL